jgi:hypothetical protein
MTSQQQSQDGRAAGAGWQARGGSTPVSHSVRRLSQSLEQKGRRVEAALPLPGCLQEAAQGQ